MREAAPRDRQAVTGDWWRGGTEWSSGLADLGGLGQIGLRPAKRTDGRNSGWGPFPRFFRKCGF